MIPKAQILDFAKDQGLAATTVEKDYVLGWLLYAIANNEKLSRWAFKGGTCLKKCFFETYRFSEDLDFTIPTIETVNSEEILSGLSQLADWIEERTGIQFPRDGIEVEKYDNKHGKPSYQAKMTYDGPLQVPRKSLQRVKFDLTQDEILVNQPTPRAIHHPYSDLPESEWKVACYSVNEVLAEKSRALYERQGRARDVYDLVHLSRNFREVIEPEKAKDIILKKFNFRELPQPTVETILSRIDNDSLRSNWAAQLGHQLQTLPSVDSFIAELRDSLAWWLEPMTASAPLPKMALKVDETILPRQLYPIFNRLSIGGFVSQRRVLDEQSLNSDMMNKITYAARNRLLVKLNYHGADRVVEPYSLRRKRTGNLLLYVHQVQKGDTPEQGTRSYFLREVQSVGVTEQTFSPRYAVEL